MVFSTGLARKKGLSDILEHLKSHFEYGLIAPSQVPINAKLLGGSKL
jgi:hypothetical protein